MKAVAFAQIAGVKAPLVPFLAAGALILGKKFGLKALVGSAVYTLGIASFEQEEGSAYTVHVYQVPEGYAEDKTEYPAPETYGDITITLRASE